MSFATDHHLGSTPDTVVWGRLTPHAPPALRVQSGESVTIDTLNPVGVALDNPGDFFVRHGLPITDAAHEILAVMATVDKGPGPHILTGPIAIADARPGDTLEVRIEAIRVRQPAYGVNFSFPGAGSLPGLLREPWMKVLPIDLQRQEARFSDTLALPLAPFMGIMGVAPTTEVSSIPPGPFGGNIDLKHLRPGSRLYLPVQVPEALFFVGDGHGVQGHGEVNLTALETSLTGVFTFVLHRDCPLEGPVAETPQAYLPMGLDPDLDLAAEQAVRRTVQTLSRRCRLSPEEAYALSSLAVDFEITQIVDGVKGVHGWIPKTLVDPSRASDWWGPGAASPATA